MAFVARYCLCYWRGFHASPFKCVNCPKMNSFEFIFFYTTSPLYRFMSCDCHFYYQHMYYSWTNLAYSYEEGVWVTTADDFITASHMSPYSTIPTYSCYMQMEGSLHSLVSLEQEQEYNSLTIMTSDHEPIDCPFKTSVHEDCISKKLDWLTVSPLELCYKKNQVIVLRYYKQDY